MPYILCPHCNYRYNIMIESISSEPHHTPCLVDKMLDEELDLREIKSKYAEEVYKINGKNTKRAARALEITRYRLKKLINVGNIIEEE